VAWLQRSTPSRVSIVDRLQSDAAVTYHIRRCHRTGSCGSASGIGPPGPARPYVALPATPAVAATSKHRIEGAEPDVANEPPPSSATRGTARGRGARSGGHRVLTNPDCPGDGPPTSSGHDPGRGCAHVSQAGTSGRSQLRAEPCRPDALRVRSLAELLVGGRLGRIDEVSHELGDMS